MQAPTPHSFPLPLPPKRNMMDTLTLLHTRLSTASEKSGRKLGGMRPLWRSGSSSFFLWGENRRICTCPPVWGSSTRDCGWSVTKPADYVHLAWFCVEKETVTVKCNTVYSTNLKKRFLYCILSTSRFYNKWNSSSGAGLKPTASSLLHLLCNCLLSCLCPYFVQHVVGKTSPWLLLIIFLWCTLHLI